MESANNDNVTGKILCIITLVSPAKICKQYHIIKIQGSLNKFPDFFRMALLLIVHT